MSKKILTTIRLRTDEFEFLDDLALKNDLLWNEKPNRSGAVSFLIRKFRTERSREEALISTLDPLSNP